MTNKGIYEFRVRRTGDFRDWTEIPAHTTPEETDNPQLIAETMATIPHVKEVRYNKKGSKQGYYTPPHGGFRNYLELLPTAGEPRWFFRFQIRPIDNLEEDWLYIPRMFSVEPLTHREADFFARTMVESPDVSSVRWAILESPSEREVTPSRTYTHPSEEWVKVQDVVDNAIHDLIIGLNPEPENELNWNIEHIGRVRDVLAQLYQDMGVKTPLYP